MRISMKVMSYLRKLLSVSLVCMFSYCWLSPMSSVWSEAGWRITCARALKR